MPVCETVRCWGNLHCSLAQAYEMPRDGVIWLLVYSKDGLANSEFCDQFISLASSGELLSNVGLGRCKTISFIDTRE